MQVASAPRKEWLYMDSPNRTAVVEVCRTREGKFVGSAIMFGVDDLFFVNSNINFLVVEKKKVGNTLVATISGRPKT